MARWRFSKMTQRDYEEVLNTGIKARYIKLSTGTGGRTIFEPLVTMEEATSQVLKAEE
jgi:hypothetical protein